MGQVHKNSLGNVRCEIGGDYLPPRGGIDQIRVAHDNFAKCGLGPAFGVMAEQLGIRLLVHSPIKQPPLEKSDKVFSNFTVCAVGERFKTTHAAGEKIHFDGAHLRRDIAATAI